MIDGIEMKTSTLDSPKLRFIKAESNTSNQRREQLDQEIFSFIES